MPQTDTIVAFGLAVALGWSLLCYMKCKRCLNWLEQENSKMGGELLQAKQDRDANEAAVRRLKAEIKSDASGHVARDPKTGRFTKEQSA